MKNYIRMNYAYPSHGDAPSAWQRDASIDTRGGVLVNAHGRVLRRAFNAGAVRDYACANAVELVELRGVNLRVVYSNGNASSSTVTPAEAETFHKGRRGFPDAVLLDEVAV